MFYSHTIEIPKRSNMTTYTRFEDDITKEIATKTEQPRRGNTPLAKQRRDEHLDLTVQKKGHHNLKDYYFHRVVHWTVTKRITANNKRQTDIQLLYLFSIIPYNEKPRLVSD